MLRFLWKKKQHKLFKVEYFIYILIYGYYGYYMASLLVVLFFPQFPGKQLIYTHKCYVYMFLSLSVKLWDIQETP